MKTITIKGLKGHDDTTLELEPLTAIIGPNGTGKTAILDAVQLLLTGQHPALGKTGKKIMTIASGTALDLEGVLDDGRTIRRTWKMDARGSVKATSVDVHDLDGQALTTAFNPRAFLSLSAKDRAAYLMGAAAHDDQVVRDQLDQLVGGPDRLTSTDVDVFEGDMGQAVEAAEKALVDERKAAKQDVARLKQLRDGLEDTARKDAPEEVTAEQASKVAEDYEGALSQQLRLEERRKAGARRLEKAKDLEGATWSEQDEEALKTAQDLHQQHVEDRQRWEAGQRQRQDILEGAPEPEEVEAARQTLENPPTVAEPKQTTLELRAAKEAAGRSIWSIDDRLRTLVEDHAVYLAKANGIQQGDSCPCCGAQGESFKAAHLKLVEAEIEAHEKRVAEFQTAKDRQVERLGQIEIDLGTVAAWENYRAAQAIVDRDQAIDQQMAALPPLKDAPEAGWPGTIAFWADKLAELKERKARAEARAELGDVPSEIALAELDAQIEKGRTMLGSMGELKKAVVAKRDAWLAHAGAQAQVHKIAKELAAAMGRLDKIAAAITQVRGIAAEQARKIAEPIEQELAWFCEGVLPGRIDVDDNLEIWYEEGSRRPFHALSGSEQAVVAFALAAALASRTACKVAFLDEASTLDEARREAFLARIQEGVGSGQLDQAIATDHRRAETFKANGWKVVNMEGGAA